MNSTQTSAILSALDLITFYGDDRRDAAKRLGKALAKSGLSADIFGGHLREENDWKHYAWTVTLRDSSTSATKAQYFDWKCGTGHVTKPQADWQTPKPIPPNPAEVLGTCCRDYVDARDAGGFEPWASEYHGDINALPYGEVRKHRATYDTCLELGVKLKALGLTREEIDALAQVAACL